MSSALKQPLPSCFYCIHRHGLDVNYADCKVRGGYCSNADYGANCEVFEETFLHLVKRRIALTLRNAADRILDDVDDAHT